MVPLRVCLPVPATVKAPVPLRTPEKVLSVLLSAPVVKLAAWILTEPAPAKEPTVSVRFVKFSVAPAATVTADVSAITWSAPVLNVPALMTVGPV